jgi:hypothetical protein
MLDHHNPGLGSLPWMLKARPGLEQPAAPAAMSVPCTSSFMAGAVLSAARTLASLATGPLGAAPRARPSCSNAAALATARQLMSRYAARSQYQDSTVSGSSAGTCCPARPAAAAANGSVSWISSGTPSLCNSRTVDIVSAQSASRTLVCQAACPLATAASRLELSKGTLSACM